MNDQPFKYFLPIYIVNSKRCLALFQRAMQQRVPARKHVVKNLEMQLNGIPGFQVYPWVEGGDTSTY